MFLRHAFSLLCVLALAGAGLLRAEDDDDKPVKRHGAAAAKSKGQDETTKDASPKKKGAAGKLSAKAAAEKKARDAEDEDSNAPAAPKKKVGTAQKDAESSAIPVKGPKRTTQPEENSDADTQAVKKPKISEPATEEGKAGESTGSGGTKAGSAKPVKSVGDADHPAGKEHAAAASIRTDDLAEFSSQPPKIQKTIAAALELTTRNLTYTYGSSDPASGGMDCSGTIYYLLRNTGITEPPRDSSGQYVWVRKKGPFFAVVSTAADGFEFADLRPGDLLFWTGNYQVHREVPITHVMMYLGKEKKSGKRVMFGASDGRSYDGIQRWGVSVFDFKMPRADAEAPEKAGPRFVGYGRVPGLRDSDDAAKPEKIAATEPETAATATEEHKEAKAETPTTPKPKHRAAAKARKSD